MPIELPFELPGPLGASLGGDTRPHAPEGAPTPVVPATPPVVLWQVGDWRSGASEELRVGVSARTARWSLLDPAEARFTFTTAPWAARDFKAGINDLWIRRDGELLGRFRIVGESTDFAAVATTSVTARDYFYLLSLRPVRTALSWTAVDQATIGWDIITAGMSWGPGVPLVKDVDWVDTGVLRSDVPVAAEDSSLKALQTIAQLPNGFEPYVNPDMTVSLNYGGMGEDRGVVLDYIQHDSSSPSVGAIASVNRVVDLTNYANAIRQSGADGITPVEAFISEVDGRAEGVWVKSLGDTALNSSNLVSGTAQANLKTYSEIFPEYTVTLRQGFWQGPNHIWLGDTVGYNIIAGDFNIQRQGRVTEISITWGSSNEEVVSISISKNTLKGARRLREIIKDLQHLTLR